MLESQRLEVGKVGKSDVGKIERFEGGKVWRSEGGKVGRLEGWRFERLETKTITSWKLIPSTIPSLYLPHKNFSLVTFGHQSSTKYTALYQFRLDLEVTHGEEDLVVLQQRGQEVLLEVERVVRLPPVLLAYQLPLEGGEAAAALLLLALDCIYVSPFTILLSIWNLTLFST